MENKKSHHHLLFVEGYHFGLIFVWIKKHKMHSTEHAASNEETMYVYWPDSLLELGFCGLLDCRDNGKKQLLQLDTSPQSFAWKQFVFIVPEKDNTYNTRAYICKELIKLYNNNVGTDMYYFKHKVKFAGDLTCDNFNPISYQLYDEDVKSLAECLLNNGKPIDFDLKDSIVSKFWIDVSYGKNYLKTNISSEQNKKCIWEGVLSPKESTQDDKNSKMSKKVFFKYTTVKTTQELLIAPLVVSDDTTYCNLLFIQAYDAGVVTAWIKKHMTYEEGNPYTPEHNAMNDLQENNHDVHGFITHRKGVNGKTPKKHHSLKGDMNWNQFVFVLPEKDNTPENRAWIAEKILNTINKNIVKGSMFHFEHRVEFAGDLTKNPLQPVSEGLLDEDVKHLMSQIYQTPIYQSDIDMDYLASHEKIMKQFWTNIQYGKQYLTGKNDD